jgi:hypothetical protein
VKKTFSRFAKTELSYRNVADTAERDVLNDIFQTALCIVTRGADGNFKNKTVFQYDFKNVRNVITRVIESVSKEIEDEFTANPTKKFGRQGTRAVYYNGNYYRVEIEPSGRLLTFHPYNDDKERENDNL